MPLLVRGRSRGSAFTAEVKAPKKYVVSRTLQKPTWRNTTGLRSTTPYPTVVVGLDCVRRHP